MSYLNKTDKIIYEETYVCILFSIPVCPFSIKKKYERNGFNLSYVRIFQLYKIYYY